MLKPIAKPVLIALTMMLMSLSPMVGTTSGTSSAYYDLMLDDGTYIYDGDSLHIATDPAVQGGYYGETDLTLDLQGLVVGDSYEYSLMIEDTSGYIVVEQYDNITATGNDHQDVYTIGLQADCDYVANIDVSHWDGTTMMFVGHTNFDIDVGDDCEDIEEIYESHIVDEHAKVIMMPDRPDHGDDDEINADIIVFFKTELSSSFRSYIDMTYGDDDGTVDQTEAWDSGLWSALNDNGPDEINWTLDGSPGMSGGDDINYFVDIDDVAGSNNNDPNPIIEAYLLFNVTGLGGMSEGDTQQIEFPDFSSDGNIYFQEFGDMLRISDMTLDGNQSNYQQAYWSSTDTMFECDDTAAIEELIEWQYVNDGYEDCMNGEDETEDYDDTVDSDGNGNYTDDSDKMFVCNKHDDHGNSDVTNWNNINDGYNDCYNGEDEGYEHYPAMWHLQQGEGTLSIDLEYPNHDHHDDHGDHDGEWWDDMGISFELRNHEGVNGVSLYFTYIFTSFNDTGGAKDTREMADSDEDGIVDDVEADQFVDDFRKMVEDNEDDRTYYCHDSAGNEYEIDFELVNDGYEDCPDGADEPQDMDLTHDSDGDGDTTNDDDSWFDCNDHNMTTVNMNVVNDGVYDCPNGEDEGGESDDNMFPFYLDGEHLGLPNGNFFGTHTNLLGVVNGTNNNDTVIHATFEFAVNDSSQHGTHKFEIIENPSNCVDVVAGEVAPSDGEFTYASNGTTIPVTKGDVAPEAGEFCSNDDDDHDHGDHGGSGNQDGTGGGNQDGTGGGNQDGGASDHGPVNGTGNGTGHGNHNDDDRDSWSMSILSSDDWLLMNVTTNDGITHELNEYHDDEFAPSGEYYLVAIFEAVDHNSTECPAGEVMNADGDCVADPGPEECPNGEVMDSDGNCVADPALNCPAGEIWDDATESCVDDGIVKPEDCVAPQIYQETNGTGACVDDTSPKPEDCTAHEMWDNSTSSCVDDGLVHADECADDETHQINSDGVGECVKTVVEPQVCPEGFEDLDEDPTTACTPIEEDNSNTTVVDTAPTCEVHYWVGSAGTPQNNWNWTEMKSDWTEFDAPNNGEYTLALPPGDYYVYFGCWDEQGDDITLAVDGLPEIQEFEAEHNWVWGWDEFSITEEDMDMEHDMIVSWSSTDFGGNVTIHFKAVASLAESVSESDTAGLPGFTASLGLMAMLGAALVLTRRKDE